MKGTPKTLKEAIKNGIVEPQSGHPSDNIYDHVKDFLAQKVQVAIFRNPNIEAEIKKLWEEITRVA